MRVWTKKRRRELASVQEALPMLGLLCAAYMASDNADEGLVLAALDEVDGFGYGGWA